MKAFETSSSESKVIYLFIFSLAGLFLAGSLVTVVNGIYDGQLMLSAGGIRLSSAIQMVFMFFMPALTLMVWSGQKPISFLGLRDGKGVLSLSFLAVVIMFASMPFISLITHVNQLLTLPPWLSGLEYWMQNLEKSAQETTNLLLAGTSIWAYLGNILVVGVFAAVAEEFFFRGALQQLLVKLFKNKHVGVWMTAFIFSMMHLQFYGFLPRFVLGLLLGYLFVYSKNLWIPILIHFLNNALVVTFNFFFRENPVYQYIENSPISLTFIVVGLASLGLFIYLLRLFKTRAYI